ncbi:MAG: phosphate acyltransferase [Oscillospiraceae bacterium]|nr:phosphate acyltransferase [Oscillospiraceae bacterium]
MKISSLEDLSTEAKSIKNKTSIVIVEAHDKHTLESVTAAANDGIIAPILIGKAAQIATILADLGASPSDYNIIPSINEDESLAMAIEMVNAGQAKAIMKGKLESGSFIKAIVKKENHMLSAAAATATASVSTATAAATVSTAIAAAAVAATASATSVSTAATSAATATLSLAGLFKPRKYHKMLAISDIGLNTYPDANAKKAIIENAVKMLKTLGIENPKVAVLSAVEKVNPKMPETIDADALKQMNRRGEITGCIIEGPISFDLATDPSAAAIKGYSSPVAGDADLLIVPDFVSGNILVKSLTQFAGTQTAGAVLGAKVPIVFTSRSADASDKYNSIALAACLGYA